MFSVGFGSYGRGEATATARSETAKKAVPDFNKEYAPWVYELSSWTFEKFRKTRDELMEDIPQEEPKKDDAAKAGVPKTPSFLIDEPDAKAGGAQDKATSAAIDAGSGGGAEGKSKKEKGKTE